MPTCTMVIGHMANKNYQFDIRSIQNTVIPESSSILPLASPPVLNLIINTHSEFVRIRVDKCIRALISVLSLDCLDIKLVGF